MKALKWVTDSADLPGRSSVNLLKFRLKMMNLPADEKQVVVFNTALCGTLTQLS